MAMAKRTADMVHKLKEAQYLWSSTALKPIINKSLYVTLKQTTSGQGSADLIPTEWSLI